jgi:hypothetical protein
MALRLPFDTDFWWHIRAGQNTLSFAKPVLTDLYSFTKLGSAWINHSWLGQVIFYMVFNWFSFPGVMVFVAMVAALSIFFIYKTMSGPVLLRAFILVLTVAVSAVIWAPRPQLFTFLFLAFEQYLLQQTQKFSKTTTFIVFLLLFVVWSNIHAGFSLGILFLAVWFLGSLIDRLFDHNNQFSFQKNDLYWVVLILLSSLVVMINPNGWNVWWVQINTISVSVLQDLIPEWASPNFHELIQQPFLWAWLLVLFFAMAIPKQIPTAKMLPLLLFGYLGFVARRNFGPFAILVTPILSELVVAFYLTRMKDSVWIRQVLKRSAFQNKPIRPALTKAINLILFSILTMGLLGKFVYLSNPVIINYYEEQLYPKKAVMWLQENKPPGNGLNEYAWGGYMDWYLQENRVFVDGRTDLFGDEIILDWLALISGSDDWPRKINQYDIEWVFLEKGRPLNSLLRNQQWILVYEDEISIILQAP